MIGSQNAIICSWDDEEVAVTRGKEFVIGAVASMRSNIHLRHQQLLQIEIKFTHRIHRQYEEKEDDFIEQVVSADLGDPHST
jgi:hypothetical protein